PPRTLVSAQEPSVKPKLETTEDNSRRAAGAADPSVVKQGFGRDRSPARYKQSQAEAARAFDELQKLEGWGGTFGDDELTHWHTLLRKGYAADAIVDIAADYLLRSRDGMTPSLGGWLAYYESYLEDDDVAISPPSPHSGPRPTASHHSHGV